MHMLRHYFISDSLDDLEVFEEQLEAAGVSTPQIHVLSRNDAEVEQHHHLHEVQSFMKNDIVHSTALGAVIGLCASALVLAAGELAVLDAEPADRHAAAALRITGRPRESGRHRYEWRTDAVAAERRLGFGRSLLAAVGDDARRGHRDSRESWAAH